MILPYYLPGNNIFCIIYRLSLFKDPNLAEKIYKFIGKKKEKKLNFTEFMELVFPSLTIQV